MSTDFVDQDLLSSVQPTSPEEPKSESYYSRHKKELPEELTRNTDELERLRQRQEALERRKQEINDQRRRIELFEHNRRDLLDKLRRNGVMVVREGEMASRMAALCSEVGSLFSRLHTEMESFAPETWQENEYDARLTDALAKVDAATAEYRKSMDRVSAVDWHASALNTASDSSDASPDASSHRGFTHWFLAGLAFSLPLVILLTLAAVGVAKLIATLK